MKFRRLLKGMQLWIRATRARRQYKRALKDFEALKISGKQEIDRITAFYEKALEVERKRYTIMMTQWADRFIQKDNLPGIALSTIGLEDRVETKSSKIDSYDPYPEQLRQDERELFEETKKQFWIDGESEGKSAAEISKFWEEMQEPVLRDIRNQFTQ